MICKVRLKGIAPGLLMNSLGGYGKSVPDEIKKKGIKDLKGWYEIDKPGAMSWEAENGAYRMSTPIGPDNKLHALCITQDVLWGCFLKGCAGFKVKIGGKNTSANYVFPSVLSLNETEIPLTDEQNVPLTRFTDQVTKIVRIPPGPKGARVPKTWGRLFPWFANFSIQTTQNVNQDHLKCAKEVLVYSGTFQGIMDGRPGLRHFNFGRFEVEQFVVCDDEGTPLNAVAVEAPAEKPKKSKKETAEAAGE